MNIIHALDWFAPLCPHVPDQGEHMGFRSAKSNYYTCRADNGVADFRWINDSGEQMTSRSTRYSIQVDTLTVKSDILEDAFEGP